MAQLIELLLSSVSSWGYWGIFIMMAIESTVIPLPSEVVMIPAGYLVQQEKMDVLLVIASGTLGSVVGALLNYYLAKILGRTLIQKYGKYFFMPPERLFRVERFFETHGSFSTFSGRLIPVVRHLISIVAGFALMKKRTFILYTGVGAGIWVTVLTALGYFIGQNEQLIKESLQFIVFSILALLVIGTLVYVKIYKKKRPCEPS